MRELIGSGLRVSIVGAAAAVAVRVASASLVDVVVLAVIVASLGASWLLAATRPSEVTTRPANEPRPTTDSTKRARRAS